MSRSGNCYDDAPPESFWGSLKNELVHHQRYATRADARAAIQEYIESFYNRQRRHSRPGNIPIFYISISILLMKNSPSSKPIARAVTVKEIERTKRPDPIGITSTNNVLSNRPGYLVRRMHQLAVNIFAQDLASSDLTPVQYGVLATVCAFPKVDQVSTAEAVGVDRTTIVSVIDRLERKGLITRAAAPYDKRMRLLEATTAGFELIDALAETAEHHRVRLLEPLSQAEAALFIEMMKRIIEYNYPLTESSKRSVDDS